MFSVMARVCVDDEVHGVEVLSSPKKVVVIIFVRGSAKVRLGGRIPRKKGVEWKFHAQSRYRRSKQKHRTDRNSIHPTDTAQ